MAESVYKVIELVGTSTESWERAVSTSRSSTKVASSALDTPTFFAAVPVVGILPV
jgi:flavin-binding protein dodecin